MGQGKYTGNRKNKVQEVRIFKRNKRGEIDENRELLGKQASYLQGMGTNQPEDRREEAWESGTLSVRL